MTGIMGWESMVNSVSILFSRSPHSYLAVFIDFDVNHTGVAANWTVLDVLLLTAFRKIDGHDDLFATGIANVARFAFQTFTL
jgi:hypothetical protein